MPRMPVALVQRRGRFGLFTACSKTPDLQVHQEKEDRRYRHRLSQLRRRDRPQARDQARPLLLWLQHLPQVPLATWDEPQKQPCPKCGKPFILRRSNKKEGTFLHCQDENCGWKGNLRGGLQ